MAGERSLDCHFGSFVVANLADHDDIGIGTQKSAHRGGEVKADFWIHLDLTKPGLRDFNRILGRPDLSI
jgi:hypothetical protein